VRSKRDMNSSILMGNSAPDSADIFQSLGGFVLTNLCTRFDTAQQKDAALAARLAVGRFDDELARLLLQHKAALERRRSDGHTSLASSHSLKSNVLGFIRAVTASTAERGVTPLTVHRIHRLRILC